MRIVRSDGASDGMNPKALISKNLDGVLRYVGYGVCCAGVFIMGMLLLFTWLDDFVLVWRFNYHESTSVIANGTLHYGIQGSMYPEVEDDTAELSRFISSDRYVYSFQRQGPIRFPASEFSLHLGWALVGFGLPLVIVAGRGVIRRRGVRRRARRGQCLNCGYNLTLNQSGTCPECGSEIEREATSEKLRNETSGSSAAPPGRNES